MANDPNWRLPAVPTFELTSPDFADGDELPHWARSSSAGGEDRSPEFHWSGAPEGTKSFAFTLYDPDAPTGSGWWHWAVYNLAGHLDSLPADAGNPDAALLPYRATTLLNELRLDRYHGAAPPQGDGQHRYFFTLSALDVETLEIEAGSTPAILGFHVKMHILARAQLMGVTSTP